MQGLLAISKRPEACREPLGSIRHLIEPAAVLSLGGHSQPRLRVFHSLGHRCPFFLELGVTRERVRQIQMDALRKLRRILEHSGYSRENILEE